MRKILAVLAVTSLAALPATAHAEPAVQAVVIEGSIYDTTVTCDTSTYPAASYPCDFDVTVTGGCLTPEALSRCTLSVRGIVNAVPSPYPSGTCAMTAYGLPWFTLTYDSPSFHVETSIQPLTIVPRSGVVYGSSFAFTPWEIVFERVSTDGAAGSLVTGFGFSDLAYDCRTHDGGDPTASGGPIWPLGAFLFHRA